MPSEVNRNIRMRILKSPIGEVLQFKYSAFSQTIYAAGYLNTIQSVNFLLFLIRLRNVPWRKNYVCIQIEM